MSETRDEVWKVVNKETRAGWLTVVNSETQRAKSLRRIGLLRELEIGNEIIIRHKVDKRKEE